MGEIGQLLLLSCLENNAELVLDCLENGAKVDRKALNGRTLLGLAAEKGNCGVMKVLLQNNKLSMISSESPTDYIFNGNVTPEGMDGLEWDCEMFEETSSGVESDPIYSWYADILEKTGPLLQEVPEDVDADDAFGRQAIHYAAKEGHLAAVELLLDFGCSVNTIDKTDKTPLYLAVESNRIAVVKLLLQHGANYGYSTPEGSTLLHLCAINGLAECAKLLIEAGSLVNITDSMNSTPLIEAVRWQQLEVAKLLIANSAWLNTWSLYGNSPIDIAIYNNDYDMLKLLVDAGAKAQNPETFYQMLNYCIRRCHAPAFHLLLQARGNIPLDMDFSEGNPMCFALSRLNIPMAKILLDYGYPLRKIYDLSGQVRLILIRCGRNCETIDQFWDLFERYGWDPNRELTFGSLNCFYPNPSLFHLLRRCSDIKKTFQPTSSFPYEGFPSLKEIFRRSGFVSNKTFVDNAYYHQPLSLEDYSRLVIRRHLEKNIFLKIDMLPLPTRLKKFLKFENIECLCKKGYDFSNFK